MITPFKKNADKKYKELESPRRSRRAKSVKKSKLPFLRFSAKLTNNPIGSVIREIFTNKSLFSKLSVTLFILAIFRGMASIPLPGIDMQVYKEFFGSVTASEASYFFTIFTGGQLDTPSIVGLGIAAFINASIILQLMTPVIPKLHELSKEGERGQQAIQQYTRYLTLPLSFFYSIAYLLFLSQRDLNSADGVTQSASPAYLIPHASASDWPTVTKLLFMAVILSAGSLLIMWLAEVVSEKGIGNGSSIIIGAGILASLPGLIKQDFSTISLGDTIKELVEGSLDILLSANVLVIVSVILGALVTIMSIVFINESARKIPIQYARRLRGSEGEKANFPIKLTVSGVMPMIFGSALLSIPQLLVPLIQNFADDDSWLMDFANKLETSIFYATSDSVVDIKDVWYSAVYFLLIIGFAMFYAFIILKPHDAAENLQKSGGFIPGIRPGQSTATYISNVLLRISFAGGIFLAMVALIPLVARNIILYETGINMAVLSGIGGTSVLIIISVILDTVRQYNALKVSRSYEKYVK